MEIKPSEDEVQEIHQLEDNSTPVVHTSVPTPPKKRKRATPSENDSGLGRETSDIWKHFTKFIDKDDKVMDTLSRLYNCYKDSFAENSDEILGGQVSTMSEGDTGEIWQSQWEKYLQEQDNEGSKTDLEMYLADDLELAKDFNILSWWKDASKRSTPKEFNIEDILEEIQKLEVVQKEYPDNDLRID